MLCTLLLVTALYRDNFTAISLPRLVDTVDVAEAGGDGEVGADRREGLVDSPDVLGLGVERGVVDVLVVNAVLFTTGD